MTGSASPFTDDALTLAERAGDHLRDRDATLATAESATGGLVGGAVTAVPGASDYYLGSVAAYAYDAKRRLLGVDREALDEHGAVSAPVVRGMARGARDVVDATWAVSTTGIAGPSGGSASKPVGTVFVGVAHAAPWGSGASFSRATRYEFDGDRAAVRAATVEQAFSDLLDAMDEVGD